MNTPAKETDAPPAGGSNQPLDVLVIGAGFSGIGAGIKLLEQGRRNFRIVEKSRGIGGTWYDNTYPGATCDVPSHLYCFSFEPNPRWSRVYSPQPEIQRYLEHCADKYGLRPFIEHHAELQELRFDERTATWQATFANGATQFARHVINGAGGLHEPAYPDIPGRESFTGAAMHTARWNHAVDLAGKRVAVIGTAASAIQVIPEVAKLAEKVIVLQRTPNYIAPRMDRAYSDTEKARFGRWPWLARFYRWLIFMRMELLLFPLTRKDSRRGSVGGKRLKDHMRSVVAQRELHEALEPDYTLGCKRILISDDFYASLNRANVQLVTSGIERIEPHGVVTHDDGLLEADVIVYATGFDIDAHMRRIRTYGLEGKCLQDEWADGQEAYQGAMVKGFPNYYMVTGPNTGVSTTSVVFMIEKQIDYILQLIDLATVDRAIVVRGEAQDRYNEKIHKDLQDSVWASGCSSWYRRPDGRITTLYPYNARHFAKQKRHVVLDHFELLPATQEMPAADSAVTAAIENLEQGLAN